MQSGGGTAWKKNYLPDTPAEGGEGGGVGGGHGRNLGGLGLSTCGTRWDIVYPSLCPVPRLSFVYPSFVCPIHLHLCDKSISFHLSPIPTGQTPSPGQTPLS